MHEKYALFHLCGSAVLYKACGLMIRKKPLAIQKWRKPEGAPVTSPSESLRSLATYYGERVRHQEAMQHAAGVVKANLTKYCKVEITHVRAKELLLCEYVFSYGCLG